MFKQLEILNKKQEKSEFKQRNHRTYLVSPFSLAIGFESFSYKLREVVSLALLQQKILNK